VLRTELFSFGWDLLVWFGFFWFVFFFKWNTRVFIIILMIQNKCKWKILLEVYFENS